MAQVKEIKIPDIGGASSVDVIEVLVNVGDVIEKDASLVTLETDKASMEIPSSASGVVQSINIKVGDKVAEGDLILTLSIAEDTSSAAPKPAEVIKPEELVVSSEKTPVVEVKKQEESPVQTAASFSEPTATTSGVFSAGPAVRRLARQFGINLADVQGTGRKSRIAKSDLEEYIKERLKKSHTSSGISVAPAPSIDFSQFGPIEQKPLNKIKRLTGVNVHRSWVSIPHVTQFDEADITELEAFRQSEGKKVAAQGHKLTLLAFVCKVVSKALSAFPSFNASLDATGENLIYKQYCNIGIAVETPNGLVVPVIRNVDALSVNDIAKEMARLSAKAREKGLMPNDMNGGCFTISSLGGIGGTAFTPIVNSPEVAILGLSRSSMKPIYDDVHGEFVPRLMLPLSLSYDHRVIDGAEAARFTRYIADCLSDIRRILL